MGFSQGIDSQQKKDFESWDFEVGFGGKLDEYFDIQKKQFILF